MVTVTTFQEEDEAIELANAVDFGLVAGVWSTDYPRALRVARRVRAGTVWIWDNYAQPVEGIWGCFKQSGIGRELGYHGLDDFLVMDAAAIGMSGMDIEMAVRHQVPIMTIVLNDHVLSGYSVDYPVSAERLGFTNL